MDKPRKQRPIIVYKEVDCRGVKHDVDAKVFDKDAKGNWVESTCSSKHPPRKWEVGKYADRE